MSIDKEFQIPLSRALLRSLISQHQADIRAHPVPETESEYQGRIIDRAITVAMNGLMIAAIIGSIAAISEMPVLAVILLSMAILLLLMGLVSIAIMFINDRRAHSIDTLPSSQWNAARVQREIQRAEARRQNERAVQSAQIELGNLLEDMNRKNPGKKYTITPRGIICRRTYSFIYRNLGPNCEADIDESL